MGCSSAKGAAPPEGGDLERRTSTETVGDDLSWVPSRGAGSPVTPGRAVALKEAEPGETNGKACSRGPVAAVTVQVYLEDGWRDYLPEESGQICEHLGRGTLTFKLQARGQTYLFDFENSEQPLQTNARSGVKRKLRLIDADDGTGPPDKSRDDLGASTGSKSSSLSSSSTVAPEVLKQRDYGAQSRRGNASQHPLSLLSENPHAKECFFRFGQNEERLAGEWAVFYHSYSFAALIYEVNAAVGSVLFRFRSQYATLPRILVHEFSAIPDAPTLVKRFNTEFASQKRDHHPEFRRVGLSAMCSLASTGPEACLAMVFIAGYSCKDLSFRSVLENLLESCYVPKAKVKKLADAIIVLSEKHGLDVSQFGGKACKSGKAGHLLQMFIKRNLVDKLVYAAKPYGPVDEDRMPISTWVNSNTSLSVGQARVVAHPKYFMQANSVRLFVASADPTFHRNRTAFQEELIKLLGMILGHPSLREKAASGIYGGTLPSWWTSEDQRRLA